MSGRCWRLLQLAAGRGVALAASPAVAYAQSAGSWVMKTPVPASLSEVGVAMADGKVHVLGGSVLGFAGPYHQEYDPATDKWRVRSPVPRALDHLGTAVANGKVMAIGGVRGRAGRTWRPQCPLA